jgi:hypothetical protein
MQVPTGVYRSAAYDANGRLNLFAQRAASGRDDRLHRVLVQWCRHGAEKMGLGKSTCVSGHDQLEILLVGWWRGIRH